MSTVHTVISGHWISTSCQLYTQSSQDTGFQHHVNCTHSHIRTLDFNIMSTVHTVISGHWISTSCQLYTQSSQDTGFQHHVNCTHSHLRTLDFNIMSTVHTVISGHWILTSHQLYRLYLRTYKSTNLATKNKQTMYTFTFSTKE